MAKKIAPVDTPAEEGQDHAEGHVVRGGHGGGHGHHAAPPTPIVRPSAGTVLRGRMRNATRTRNTYLVDLACWAPPDSFKVTKDDLIEGIKKTEQFSPEAIDFLTRVAKASGLGDATALTPSIKKMLFRDNKYHSTYDDCRDETYMVMFDTVAELLAKTKTDPKSIDICITSCSCFAPMPSLSSVLVHKFGMRQDVQTFALAGMGCGSSVPCVDMARRLLATLPRGAKALIVNHENITNNWYVGEDRSMLLVNVLFRAGGAAVLLSNDSKGAKYKLMDVERTHMSGTDPAAVDAITVECDNRGRRGVTLSKNLTRVAAAALRANLTGMASRQLPLTELARVARAGKTAMPDLTKAFDKFLLHAGGPAVLYSAIETLGLAESHMGASLDSLKYFGNTSSATTWYALSRLEHNGDVKAGQRLLQVALGGSFKAGSCAWKALRSVTQRHECWAAVDAGSLAAARAEVGAPPDPREAQVWLCDRTEEEAPRNWAQSRYLYAAMRQALNETAADREAGIPPAKTLAPMPVAPSTLNTGPRQLIEF